MASHSEKGVQTKKTGRKTTGLLSGGARRDRTADLLHAMQALSQLSYGPMFPASSPQMQHHLGEVAH